MTGRMPQTEQLPQRRAYYRVVYPLLDRPKIFIKSQPFPIIDICEKGVRFAYRSEDGLPFNVRLAARIEFHDGEQIFVNGKVVRVEPNAVAIFLSGEIPLARIIKEQRYLIQKYPNFR